MVAVEFLDPPRPQLVQLDVILGGAACNLFARLWFRGILLPQLRAACILWKMEQRAGNGRYAGFEKVGLMGQSLPDSNSQTTRQALDYSMPSVTGAV